VDLYDGNVLGFHENDMIDFKSLVVHYMQMEKVEAAGGLRKELTPEICVIMKIQFEYQDINIIEAIKIANKVKEQVKQIHDIPF